MRVLVAGAHGKVGEHVTALLNESEHEVRAMVRKEAYVTELEPFSTKVVVADLTQEVSHAVEGCDAIIFAAGSSGNDVEGVDRDGAIKLMKVAESQGVKRFVMLSSMGAGDPERGPEALRPYLKAKKEVDERLQRSDLDYTIIRPGQLTDDAATGKIKAAEHFDEWGQVTREDVAKTLVTVLGQPSTVGQTFEILEGDTPIEEVLKVSSG